MRVLAVEDDPAVRHFVDTILSRRGHNVLSARNAELAEAQLLDFVYRPDVAVLDVVLPGMNGVVYGDMLSAIYPGLRLVFMTGWGDKVDVGRVTGLGVLLRKPFSGEQLLEAVER